MEVAGTTWRCQLHRADRGEGNAERMRACLRTLMLTRTRVSVQWPKHMPSHTRHSGSQLGRSGLCTQPSPLSQSLLAMTPLRAAPCTRRQLARCMGSLTRLQAIACRLWVAVVGLHNAVVQLCVAVRLVPVVTITHGRQAASLAWPPALSARVHLGRAYLSHAQIRECTHVGGGLALRYTAHAPSRAVRSTDRELRQRHDAIASRTGAHSCARTASP
jgi:hypothetical protein